MPNDVAKNLDAELRELLRECENTIRARDGLGCTGRAALKYVLSEYPELKAAVADISGDESAPA